MLSYGTPRTIHFPLTSRFPILHSIASNSNLLSSTSGPLQEFAMITRSVRTKVPQDFREWCVWHLNFQQIVTQRNLCVFNFIEPCLVISSSTHHAVIRTTFSSERHWFFAHPFINNPVREHRLFRDAKNECTKAVVVIWLALFPHICRTVSIPFLSLNQ